MTRNHRWRPARWLREIDVLSALVAARTFAVPAAPGAEKKSLARKRPNIILVMTDDQGGGRPGTLEEGSQLESRGIPQWKRPDF